MPFLDWVNKSQATRSAQDVPYHLLRQVSAHGDVDSPYADNLLVQGDNLLALKALLPFYRGQVKCIVIDPPYNTQSAFEHYDDRLEHSQWLSMMYPRLVLLRELLAESGSIWVTLDDNEAHYCKVLMDEVLGRQNFVANVVWEKSDSPKMDSQFFSTRHDHILVHAKASNNFSMHRLAQGIQDHYNRVDAQGRRYYTKPLRAMGGQGDSREARPNLFFGMTAPDASTVFPIRADGRDGAWRWGKEKVETERERIEWVAGKNGWSPYFRIYADTSTGRPAETIWSHSVVGSNRTSKAEVKALTTKNHIFTTPKPERLIQRILEIATNPGDLVLDSFLGSGTTAAVAHKMGRRYIGIEMGDHAQTHCLPRLQKVLEGEQGGISAQVGWQGGGGFRFCKVGSAVFDAYGAIHPDVKFNALAAYLWHFETGTPGKARYDKPRLGTHQGTAYYLLFNGILGDRRPEGGNVLTLAVLQLIDEAMPHAGPKVIYGETTSLGPARLARLGIRFKQIPYDLPLR
jgi:adenine-specific DNA-methyltransferase